MISYEPDSQFGYFLDQLRGQATREWEWLVARFRGRLIPWLASKSKQIGNQGLTTHKQFVEEVFEESILKFYELFPSGTYTKYSDLEAMVVTIAGYKLKEGFARLKREQKFFLVDDARWERFEQKKDDRQEREQEEELLQATRQAIGQLEPEERELLIRYFEGEELQLIAAEKDISPEACRKRKQRALDKLRNFVFRSANLFFLIIWQCLEKIVN